MATTVETRFREDFIADYRRRTSTLESTVRTDSIDRGGVQTFLVAGDGGTEVVTRGRDGKIPTLPNVQTPVPVTLVEHHAVEEMTGFDIFTAQASKRQVDLMRMNNLGRVMRAKDDMIISAILTGTNSLGHIPIANKRLANLLVTHLANGDVGIYDGGSKVFAALSPAAWAEMTDDVSFASAEYVHFATRSPVETGIPQHGIWKYWMGVNWVQHGGLPGRGTASAQCVAWHKDAVGYVMGGEMNIVVDYDKKNHTTFSRVTIFHGSAKLQNAGILKWTHDDTTLSS